MFQRDLACGLVWMKPKALERVILVPLSTVFCNFCDILIQVLVDNGKLTPLVMPSTVGLQRSTFFQKVHA